MNLIDQQLVLELEDDYDTYRLRAEKFCNYIINHPPLKSAKTQILANEGSIPGLVRTSLCYVLEKGDFDLGLKAMSSYLNAEYTHSNNRAKTHHTKLVLLGDNLPLVADEQVSADFREEIDVRTESVDNDSTLLKNSTQADGPATAAGLFGPSPPLPGGALSTHSARMLNKTLTTQEEVDLFELLAQFDGYTNNKVGRQQSYGQLQQAFKLLGWTKKKGMRIYHRVKRRAERLDA